MPTSHRLLALLLIAIAIALLYPGITQPVLTLTGTLEKSELAALGMDMMLGDDPDPRAQQMLAMFSSLLGLDRIEGQLQAYHNTRSIWGTVNELAGTGNLAVAFLIVFFSVVIPVFKLLLQFCWLLVPSEAVRDFLETVTRAISKWSMADVFVMALIIAYLAGSASGQMGDLLTMDAQLERGFWFFLGYCLFSIASSGLLRREMSAA